MISLSAFAASIPPAKHIADARIAKSYGKLPLSFVENKGQMDKRARYVISGPRASAYFRNDGVTFDLWEASKIKSLDKPVMKAEKPSKLEVRKHAVLKLTFKGADPKCRVEGIDKLPGKTNYMIGKDKSKWHTNVPTYKGVIYKNVWRGIDVIYRGDRNQLKYDIRVNPGADIRKVQLRYDGAQKMWLDKKGTLHIKTAVTEFIENVPGIYQEKSGKKVDVVGGYELLDEKTVGFSVKNADPSLPLVIDPASDLVYSTFLGGSGIDESFSIAVDSIGCIYVIGSTNSVDFPIYNNAYTASTDGRNTDVFVTKFNQSGSGIDYSTYIGCEFANDYGYGIAVSNDFCAYITGAAHSRDFPTTIGAFDKTLNGDSKAFVAKLNSYGNNLEFSTLLGGNTSNFAVATSGYDISVDNSGCSYITGMTYTYDFPTTINAFDRGCGGTSAFVTKMNSTGSQLIFSTYLGNVYWQRCAIAVDTSGCTYITGATNSSDFPTTPGAYKTSYTGGVNYGDAFISKFNETGSSLVYSTYLGGLALEHGVGDDFAWDIAVDSSNCASVVGTTYSITFPVTTDAYDKDLNGNSDIFVTKINSDGSSLVGSTYLGGSKDEFGYSIAVDQTGNVYVAGITNSTDFPSTPGALDSTYNNTSLFNPFIAKFSPLLNNLEYATYFGKYATTTAINKSPSICVDDKSSLYIIGNTNHTDFPVTSDAYDTTYNGGSSDAYAAKIFIHENKPDLSIKNNLEILYTGINIFNSDGVNQSKSQNASLEQSAIYQFNIRNVGNIDDSFTIKNTYSNTGWTVKYYDSSTDADITSQVTGSGWSSGTLAPDGSREIYAIVKPDSTVPFGSTKTLLITAVSESYSEKVDVVKAVTTCIANRKPDLLIKAGIETTYTGTDIINTDGTNQTKSQNGTPNQKITYTFKVRNAGDSDDSFKITGPGSVAGWNVRYYESNTGAEVTSLVTGGGWLSGTLAPGATKGIFVNVKPDATLSLGSTNTLLIKAESEADDSKIDVVKAVTTFTGIYKTDMLIKSGPDTSYSGAGTYSTDGANQTKMQNVCAGQKVTYGFRARNGGNAVDSFRITGPAGGSGWSVKYYDFTTSADVTTQVTGAGWVSSILAPGTMGGVFVNIKPDSTVPLGSSITLTVTGTSMSDNTKIDVVKAVTTCVASYKPDLMIKLGTESTYSGLDIINTDGTDQTKTQNAAINQKVTCSFRVKNAGYLSDSFTITGPSGGSGWTVKYIDLASGADVTSQVTGTGWLSGTMAPGTDKGVYAKITPDATVTSGSSKTLTITAASIGSPTKIDVVKAVTIVL